MGYSFNCRVYVKLFVYGVRATVPKRDTVDTCIVVVDLLDVVVPYRAVVDDDVWLGRVIQNITIIIKRFTLAPDNVDVSIGIHSYGWVLSVAAKKLRR